MVTAGIKSPYIEIPMVVCDDQGSTMQSYSNEFARAGSGCESRRTLSDQRMTFCDVAGGDARVPVVTIWRCLVGGLQFRGLSDFAEELPTRRAREG